MTARIASGKKVEPRPIRTRDGIEQPVRVSDDLDIPKAYLDDVRKGMTAVVNSSRGTGRGSRIAMAEWKMAGKSGTSQVRNISKAERARGVIRNDQLPWDQRDHALFVAFAPVHDPQIAVAVMVENGESGSGVAAPVAKQVMDAWLLNEEGVLKPEFAPPRTAEGKKP